MSKQKKQDQVEPQPQANVKSENEKAQERIAELEAKLEAAQKSGGGDKEMAERIAYLEGKLQKEKDQEELYHERKRKYEANVAKRKEKEAKKKAALEAIDQE